MFRFGFNLLLSINILYSFTVGSLLRFIPTPKISIIQACDNKRLSFGNTSAKRDSAFLPISR